MGGINLLFLLPIGFYIMADFLYFCVVKVLAFLLCVILIGGLISLVVYMFYMIFFCWRDKAGRGSLPWWVWWDIFRNHNR